MTPPPRMKSGKSSVYDPQSGVQLIGVRKGRKGRYEAVMRGPKRSVILLGSFDTREEAARAYDAEARELRGPKAKTNFPPVEKKDDDDGGEKNNFPKAKTNFPPVEKKDDDDGGEKNNFPKAKTNFPPVEKKDDDAEARELRGPKAKTNFPPVEKKDDDDTKKGFGTSTSSSPVDVDLLDWDFFLSQADAQLIAEPDDSQKKSTDWSSFMHYLECAQPETELPAQARLITDSDVIDYDAGARELRGPKAKTNFPPVEKKDDDDAGEKNNFPKAKTNFPPVEKKDDDAEARELRGPKAKTNFPPVEKKDDDDTKKGFGSSTSSRPVDVDLQHSDWDLFLSHLEQEDAQQIGGPDGLQKKYKDWNSFMQYLECAQPETELSALARSITDSDVIDYLGHLIKLRERKVHVRTCPFSHFPSAICTCQANEALEESLYTIAFRLEVAFHDLYNQPHHSNPFASLTVRDYLRVYERGIAEAGGSHGGGGCGAVYSGSTSSATTASIEMKLHQLNLGEIGRKRKLDGPSEDNNMVKQEAGLVPRRDQTTSSRNRTGFGLNRLLFGITKKGRSKYTSAREELMVLDEMGTKSETVQTVDNWTEGASSSLNPRDIVMSELHGKYESITGTSPEKGRFGDELNEAHSILGIEDDLMSIMGSKPFCVQILDLSGTTISSLPKCISELVTLESLTLRECRLLMELPPEIGELTNLKLLDLLGTEVVCLPKEIAKLMNLRSFRIALCGYADHFKESRGIDSVIPRNALSKLSGLSDLRIRVNPDGDWWDVEVKAVIEDLRDLGNLRTLHLDLPKVDLLDDLMRSITQLLHLSSLRFRLTVGPHEERIIHRLPKHVEKEFSDLEKFEKGLKYTNSEGIPIEIKNALNHADAFLLERHWSVKNLLEFGVENMNELKCCILLECNELQTVIDAEECEDFYGSVLGSLECLSIHYMKKMERIWRGAVIKGSLSNMKSLALHTCLSLTTVFTLDLFYNLMNLEELIIEDCPKIKTLVSSNSPNLIPQNFLPKLKTMLLLELPNLGSISSGLTIAPKLERLVIFYCPKLDKLSPVEISSRDLKVIKGEKRWWDALKWYESGTTEEEQEYLAGKFVPLRKDEDLEEQFMMD